MCIEYYGFFVLGIFKSSIPPKKTLQSLSSMDNLLIHRIFFYQNNLLAEWLYVVVQYKFVEDLIKFHQTNDERPGKQKNEGA